MVRKAPAYRIIEDTLNLRDVRIFDYVYDEHGNKKAVFNAKETTAAQAKQEVIKQAFQDWIWKDPERRNRLVRYYNDTFNSVRPREYDGSHITFGGISPEITLRPHQVNAIAHILYGGNTLLAHKVGAGKTFEMVAAAQKSKRLGLCQKSMFVVPNHLVGQWLPNICGSIRAPISLLRPSRILKRATARSSAGALLRAITMQLSSGIVSLKKSR